MLPRVVRLTGLDIYRDGGSLSASFESNNENEYSLFFPIDHRSISDTGMVEKKCYKSPILKKHIRTEYKSPITGIVSPDWKHESNPISWNEARTLMESIKPHLEGFVSDYLWVFGSMQDAAAKDGE